MLLFVDVFIDSAEYLYDYSPGDYKGYTNFLYLKKTFKKLLILQSRDFIISLDSKNKIYYLKKQKNISLVSLKKELLKYQKQGGQQVFIQADRRLNYGAVVKLMAQIQNLGLEEQ